MGSKIHVASLALPPDYLVKVEEGGTSANNKDQALINLNAVPVSELLGGNANGVLVLDGSGKVPNSKLGTQTFKIPARINGPTEAAANSVIIYEITNYSDFITYNISVNKGSFTRNKGNITIQTPAELGVMELSIDGRIIPIQLYQSRTRPTLNFTKIENVYQVSGTEFTPLVAGDSHVETHWEIARNYGFSDIVLRDYNNKESLMTYSFRSNIANYYIRCSYVGSKSNVTEWSIPIQLT